MANRSHFGDCAALAGADPETTSLWTEDGEASSRIVSAEEAVSLDKPGTERFVLKPREPKHPTIFINDTPHVIKQDHLNGAQIKALGGIEADYQLFLEQPGNDIPVPNDKSVKIVDQMHFYSLPPATFG
jgi:hypothetical protein